MYFQFVKSFQRKTLCTQENALRHCRCQWLLQTFSYSLGIFIKALLLGLHILKWYTVVSNVIVPACRLNYWIPVVRVLTQHLKLSLREACCELGRSLHLMLWVSARPSKSSSNLWLSSDCDWWVEVLVR